MKAIKLTVEVVAQVEDIDAFLDVVEKQFKERGIEHSTAMVYDYGNSDRLTTAIKMASSLRGTDIPEEEIESLAKSYLTMGQDYYNNGTRVNEDWNLIWRYISAEAR
jgi:hypothetical protein